MEKAKKPQLSTDEIVFGYLDWCKMRGFSYEQTKSIATAMEYGAELHRRGYHVSQWQLCRMCRNGE